MKKYFYISLTITLLLSGIIIFQNHSNNNGDTTTKNDGYRIYQRYYQVGGGLWNEWTELYGTHNTQLVTMQVEFSNSDTPQDYILLTKK